MRVRFGMAALLVFAGCDAPPAREVPPGADSASASAAAAAVDSASADAGAIESPLAPQSVTVQGQTLTVQFDLRCLNGQNTQMALIVSGAPPMKVFEPSSRGAMSTAVSIQIDGRAPLREPWTLTGDKEDVAISPSAVDLGMQLRGAKHLVVSFQPFGAAPATVEWDLAPLAPQLARTARECRWPV